MVMPDTRDITHVAFLAYEIIRSGVASVNFIAIMNMVMPSNSLAPILPSVICMRISSLPVYPACSDPSDLSMRVEATSCEAAAEGPDLSMN